MAIFDPEKISTKELHQYLLAIVSPRPIAFVSTIDELGRPNLAPFSFFNCFSSNPPLVIFSANRRVENNTTKDTLANVIKTKECVINTVSHTIVRQAALCSVDFETGVNEFEKVGLTPIPSDLVKPYRVAESPASMECQVQQIIELGDQGGAGNLILCRVVRIHIDDAAIEGPGKVDPDHLDLMGRMGRTYYTRASGNALEKIYQPYQPVPVGYDGLPEFIRQSSLLTANDLGILAGIETIPTDEEIDLRCSEINATALDQTQLLAEIKANLKDEDRLNAILNLFALNQMKDQT